MKRPGSEPPPGGARSADDPGARDLRRLVEAWFAPKALAEALGEPAGETEKLARRQLLASRDRSCALLAAAVFRACAAGAEATDDVRRIAIAAECFREAWLIHGDIEAGSAGRDGRKTLHAECGIPVALNVGDFLLGEGYRMIAESHLPAERKAAMLRAAAAGHSALAAARGDKLGVAGADRAAPARGRVGPDSEVWPVFEVAMRLGALCAGREAQAAELLSLCRNIPGIDVAGPAGGS